jgi:hypothetical protein
METAYVITDMTFEEHFQKAGYTFLGILKEVEKLENINEEN